MNDWHYDEVVEWLSASGFIDGRSLTDIEALSNRATCLRVSLSDGSNLIVKKPRNGRREGVILSVLGNEDHVRGVRDFVPPLLHYDESRNITVTASLAGYSSMRDVCGWRPAGDSLVRAVAARLARLHAATSGPSVSIRCEELEAANPVPKYGDFSPADLARAPGRDFPRFLAAVQSIGGAIESLRDRWHPVCLIHGDFKDDNVLVEADVADPRLVFVDWEMAGWGDPLWDVGSMVGQFIYHWAVSIKAVAGGNLASWISDAAIPFAEVRRSATAFVSSYASLYGQGLNASRDWLLRVVEFAGLFLLHRVTSTLERMGVLIGPIVNCLFVGRTLISEPERAYAIVLGARA